MSVLCWSYKWNALSLNLLFVSTEHHTALCSTELWPLFTRWHYWGGVLLLGNGWSFPGWKPESDPVSWDTSQEPQGKCLTATTTFCARVKRYNFDCFIQNLDSILQILYNSSLNIIICGDINIDYLVGSERKNQLHNLLLSYNLTSIITFPTRLQNVCFVILSR
jgi:hypothetical protein